MTNNTFSAGRPARSHRDYYTALYQATLTISSSLELEAVLQSVVTSITEAMQVKACVLRLLDERSGQLHLAVVFATNRTNPLALFRLGTVAARSLRGAPFTHGWLL